MPAAVCYPSCFAPFAVRIEVEMSALIVDGSSVIDSKPPISLCISVPLYPRNYAQMLELNELKIICLDFICGSLDFICENLDLLLLIVY